MRIGKKNRTQSRTAGEINSYGFGQAQPEEMKLFASELLNGGMVTTIHSHKLQDNQSVLVKGFGIKFDGYERRGGHSLFTPAKPNSEIVLAFTNFKGFDGTVSLFRFCKNAIHLHSTGAWTAVTGAALSGGDSDRFQTISFLDRLFFNNNGLDVLQEINLAGNTYAPAGNATKYRFYATANRRIVGANLQTGSPNPIQLGWSGDLNPTEWDNTVDPSAGNLSILEESGAVGDDITGLFGIDNVLLITRERSLWVGQPSEDAALPFICRQGIPGLGAGIPYAIAAVRGGVAWYDRRLQNVFAYVVNTGALANTSNSVSANSSLTPIGDAIKNELLDVDPENLFCGFDPKNNVYKLAITNPNTTKVAVWSYHFDSQAWTYDEMTNITGFWYLDFNRSSTTIGDLVGTIGDLVGTIGSLSANDSQITEFVGRNDGEILIGDDTETTEADEEFSSEIQSKDFKMTAVDMYVAQLKITYIPIVAGDLTISYSKDGGKTFTVYKTISYLTDSDNVQKMVKLSKQITCRQFRWKIAATNGRCKIVEYEIHVFPGSSSKGDH